MATVDQAEQTLRQLQEQRAELDKATVSSEGDYVVKGQRLTATQLRARASKLDKDIKFLESQLRPVREATAGLLRAEEVAANPITESPTGLSQADANAAVVAARKKVAQFEGAEIALPGETPVAAGGRTATQREGLRRRGQVAGGFGATPARAPTGPTGPTGPGGAGAGAGGGAGGGAGTKTPTTKLPANWENKFREMFPSQAWLLDIDRTKYPDVAALLKKGVINRSWETPESQARFVAEFNNTTFYKELATTGKVRAIKQLIGDAGFDSTPFNAFVTKAMNLGWEGDTLKFEAYREVFRKDDTGNLVNPTAVQRVQKSNDYLSVAGIGKAYFNQVSDDTVQKTLTGDMTVDDVQRQQREITKARYAHLSPLIDQGLTMDDIAASFRTQAAQLLEVDPNTIDMSRADYEVAMNFGEEGKKRVMTNGEWQKLLRTDARYGWDKTENAKSEARRLANTISQAFGRVI